MNNLAIIPARSGSKGLEDKNIMVLGDKPLLAYSIDSANRSECFTEVMVSTDSGSYAEIAQRYGAKVPFMRSETTSSDSAGSWEVVLEVLKNYQRIGMLFDTVCLLQPTSPLRRSDDIQAAYRLYKELNAEAVTSVCEVDHSPLWMMSLPSDHSMKEFRNKCGEIIPRQQLQRYYRLNGAIYIRKIRYTDHKIIICDKDEYAYVMNRKNSVDIDTMEEFDYAYYLLCKEQEK